MKTIAGTLEVARSNLAVQPNTAGPARRRGRPAKPETELLAEIKQIIAGQPTYGYRRVHALIRRRRRKQGDAAVNVKRIYRIMKAHGLLLERHTGNGVERRHMAASRRSTEHALVLGRVRDRLRQWRAGQDRLHVGLLGP